MLTGSPARGSQDAGSPPLNAPFERFDYASLPSLSRLVSNVPSGVRFAQVRTAALQRLIRRRELSGSPVALPRFPT